MGDDLLGARLAGEAIGLAGREVAAVPPHLSARAAGAGPSESRAPSLQFHHGCALARSIGCHA
jgi:hypothetical protein